MKNLLVLSLVTLSFAAFTVSAEASKKHKNAIKEGVQSGEITKDEAKELHADRKKIRKAKKDLAVKTQEMKTNSEKSAPAAEAPAAH